MSTQDSNPSQSQGNWLPQISPHVKSNDIDNINDFLKLEPNLNKSTVELYVYGAIAVVTADGTTVPLEANTVRFIDSMRPNNQYNANGAFGAVSAEYFLSRGFRVIYLHRNDSIYFPFTKSFQQILGVNRLNEPKFFQELYRYHNHSALQLNVENRQFRYHSERLIGMEAQLLRNLTKEKRFLPIEYKSIHEYLGLLDYLFKVSRYFGPTMLFYLTAKVSNYYIPYDELVTHKIQSENELELDLTPTPNHLLDYLKNDSPYTFVVERLERKETKSIFDIPFEPKFPVTDVNMSKLAQQGMDHIKEGRCHAVILSLDHYSDDITHDDHMIVVLTEKDLFNKNRDEKVFSEKKKKKKSSNSPQEGEGPVLDPEDVVIPSPPHEYTFNLDVKKQELPYFPLERNIVDQIILKQHEFAEKNYLIYSKGTRDKESYAIISGFSPNLCVLSEVEVLSNDILNYENYYYSYIHEILNEQKELKQQELVLIQKKLNDPNHTPYNLGPLLLGIGLITGITYLRTKFFS